MAAIRSSSTAALTLLPLLLAAALIPSLATSSASGPLDIGEELLMLGRFHGWMAAHSRSYATEEEKLRRLEVYRSNMEFIKAANRDDRMSYQLGETPFTDLTHDEFMAMYSSNKNNGADPSESSEEMTVITTRAGPVHEGSDCGSDVPLATAAVPPPPVPPSVDWRAKGVVTPAKNQGTCGSCCAFAALATMESAQGINTSRAPPVLSEQQLVDCLGGCTGKWMDKAYKWVIQNGGITTSEVYPYTGIAGRCQTGKPVAVRLSGYTSVRIGDESALKEAVAQQPVAVSFDYSDPCFQHYIGGVYDAGCAISGVYVKGACRTVQNHALAIVGYGTKPDGTKYWIAKNSWTDKWGDNGFIYFLRDSPPLGLCGIAALPVYPII